jgi:hypothetical protein
MLEVGRNDMISHALISLLSFFRKGARNMRLLSRLDSPDLMEQPIARVRRCQGRL